MSQSDPKNLDLSYFFKLAQYILDAEPGTYPVKGLTIDPEKFFRHIRWYNMCRPKDFKEVCILDSENISIKA